jgi:hypothetical protein
MTAQRVCGRRGCWCAHGVAPDDLPGYLGPGDPGRMHSEPAAWTSPGPGLETLAVWFMIVVLLIVLASK